jgi:hypothetical protein
MAVSVSLQLQLGGFLPGAECACQCAARLLGSAVDPDGIE